MYSRYDALSKFSCVPTATPSTAYSIGAAIALPYKATYAKTTMPAPIAAAPILRRTRRLLLTSKRCVVGDGSDMAPPERPLNNIPRWNCAATGTRLGERLRLSGGVPYLPHGALLDRSWNSRDVRRWVRTPLKQSHWMLLRSERSQHRTARALLRMLAFWPAIAFPLPRLPRSQGPSCPRRQSIATPGGLRSMPPKFSARAKMSVSNCLTARFFASFGARQP